MTELRCPDCDSDNVCAQNKAFVTQGIRINESGSLDYDAWETEDVEFDGPEWYVCRDCGEHAEEIKPFIFEEVVQ